MKKLFASALALVAFACSTPAPAQQRLLVSTGAEKGSTYTQMISELRDTCNSPTLSIGTQYSKGATENLDRLAANQVNAGVVQTDIIWLRSSADNLSNLKTLAALHPEEVHVVVKAEGMKAGSWNPLAARVQPRYVTDTRGRSVGAAGGSVISARVVSELARLDWHVREYSSTGDALMALNKGAVDIVLAVGGAPLGSLANLGPEWRVLPFEASTVEALARVYTAAKVSYPKMNSVGIPTVATEALLVTQNYRSQAYVQAVTQLRQCLARNIETLRETIGMHPKWKDVDPANHGKWSWYEPGK